MKHFFPFVGALALSNVSAWLHSPTSDDPFLNWYPPGPGDIRSPCPMLNTLANHGFLNRDGKNMTRAQLQSALPKYVGYDSDVVDLLFDAALNGLGLPMNASISFDQLDGRNSHNKVEHDASLSRGDLYFGDNYHFNQTIFSQTKSYFTEPVIDVQQAANARLARIATSEKDNPAFNLTITAQISPGEQALYLSAIGNVVNGLANTSWVVYFFEHERFPTKLGWTTRSPITMAQFVSLVKRVGATNSTVL